MRTRKQFQNQHTDKKIKFTGRAYFLLIIFMFVIVVHDSYVHDLPFYYILYALGGLLVGRFVALTQKVIIVEDKKTLTLKVKPVGMVITILLLLVRYFAGRIILEEFNVIWVMDGVYLFFIGVYFAKVKDMLRQIDDQAYVFFFDKKESS